MTQRDDADLQKWLSTLDEDSREAIRRLDKDTQESIYRDVAEASERHRQAAPFEPGRTELWARSQNPAAVELVRARVRGHNRPVRRIPIVCPNNHPSTHAVELHVEDEIDEGTPVTPTIMMDIETGATGSAEAPPMAGGSWTFVCGKCGRRTSIREPKLLDVALAALLRSGRDYRITLT